MSKKQGKKSGSRFIRILLSMILIVSIGLVSSFLLSSQGSSKMMLILEELNILDFFRGETIESDYDSYGYDKKMRIDPADINPSSDFTLTAVDGGWEINFYNNATDKTVVIPNTNSADGQPIVSIGKQAFHNMKLKSVIIPNSIKSIGDFAFWSNELTSVRIPNSVTSIGSAAFNGNRIVESQVFIYARNSDGTENTSILVSFGGSIWTTRDAIIPNTVTTIGKYAFNNIRLRSVTIPDSVTTIDDYAFYKNELSSVTIPSSVTTIGYSAFRYNSLKSITIPSSITSLGSHAFDNNMLTSITFEGPVPPTLGVNIFRNNIFLEFGSTKVPNAFLADYHNYEVWHMGFDFFLDKYVVGY